MIVLPKTMKALRCVSVSFYFFAAVSFGDLCVGKSGSDCGGLVAELAWMYMHVVRCSYAWPVS